MAQFEGLRLVVLQLLRVPQDLLAEGDEVALPIGTLLRVPGSGGSISVRRGWVHLFAYSVIVVVGVFACKARVRGHALEEVKHVLGGLDRGVAQVIHLLLLLLDLLCIELAQH